MDLKNNIIEVKAYNYKIIQKYILYSIPILILGIYISSLLSSKIILWGNMLIFGTIYWGVIELVRKKEVTIFLDDMELKIEDEKIPFSVIEHYYLSKVTNKLLGLRVKTKENKIYIYFTDLENKKLLLEYFNSNNVIEKKIAIDSYIRLFSVVIFILVILLLFSMMIILI
ncbi:hypothetical protein [Apibacter mensalis]|uniref:hypothetical protein n=1 Tax=Apibacter mensalis TaxID=1586267 RepID=UPI0026EC9AFF|nr:hypothetical protein [Apibacter mensalis]